METYKLQTNNYSVRYITYENEPYMIVPATLMTEGVRNGSGGPLLHLSEELRKFTDAWNGEPVMIRHPERNGQLVSANSPEVHIEKVGTVFNAKYDNGLKAELWININKLTSISPETLQMINNNEIIEVSIGVYSDLEESEGTFQGDSYIAISRNYRPDHLAILPFETGACSIDDGCGIRTNKKGFNMNLAVYTENTGYQVLKDGVEIKPCEFLSYIAKKGDVSISVHQLGFREVASSIQSKLDGMDTVNATHYLREVYGDYFIYYIRNNTPDISYFKYIYSVNADNTVEFIGDPIQVKEEVTYLPINNMQVNKGDKMAKEKVDAKILGELTQPQINKVLVVEEKQKKVESNPLTQNDVKELVANSYKTMEDFKTLMPSEVVTQYEYGINLYNEKKKDLVESITTNSEVFSKEELESKDISELEKLHSFVESISKPKNVYVGAPSNPLANSNGGDISPMLPLGIETKNNKE